MKRYDHDFRKRAIMLMGAALYIDEPILVQRVIDLAFEVNDKKVSIEELEEIEDYACDKIAKKIDLNELKDKAFGGNFN